LMSNRARFQVLLAGALAAGVAACMSAPNDGADQTLLSAAQCASASAWAPWTTYATGAVVSYAGGMYQCVQGHTSQPDWTPTAVPALWAAATCDGGGGSRGGGSGGGGGSGSGGG